MGVHKLEAELKLPRHHQQYSSIPLAAAITNPTAGRRINE
jgi:hypothetical protein